MVQKFSRGGGGLKGLIQVSVRMSTDKMFSFTFINFTCITTFLQTQQQQPFYGPISLHKSNNHWVPIPSVACIISAVNPDKPGALCLSSMLQKLHRS